MVKGSFGYKINILDANAEQLNEKQILQKIISHSPFFFQTNNSTANENEFGKIFQKKQKVFISLLFRSLGL